MKKLIIGGIVVAIIAALAFFSWDYTQEKKAEAKGKDEVLAKCPAEFVQKDVSDEALNRFVRGGIDASTPEKSRDKLLSAVGHDEAYLRFLADTFNVEAPKAASKMLTKDGTCLSKVGRQVHHDLSVAMKASGKKFVKANADAYNTGMAGGKAVVSRKAGISGNRKALEFTLPDGSKVIVLVRCGNPVFPDKPDIPDGPTDENPKCPPGTVGTPPLCKDTPSEDPYRQGNAGDGGGENSDKGPGDRTENPEKPGTDDRVNPTRPTPEPPKPPTPRPTPRPDPTTPPPPETEAPTPDKPGTGCVPIPGVEDCK